MNGIEKAVKAGCAILGALFAIVLSQIIISWAVGEYPAIAGWRKVISLTAIIAVGLISLSTVLAITKSGVTRTPPVPKTPANLSRAKDITAIGKTLAWTLILLAGASWLIVEVLWKMNQSWSSAYVEKQRAEGVSSVFTGMDGEIKVKPGFPEDPEGWTRVDGIAGWKTDFTVLHPTASVWIKTDAKPPVSFRSGDRLSLGTFFVAYLKSATNHAVLVKVERKRL